MKGPGLRLKIDVHRHWTCPACGRKLVTGGDVISLTCGCKEPPLWMRMEDPKTNPRPEPRMPEASTLTDEDFDRLGIDALKEPESESSSNESTSVADALIVGESTDENSPSETAEPESDDSARLTGTTEVVNDSSNREPVQPHHEEGDPDDDFGAGLVDD